jgi:hypothetical protein
MMEWQPIETAPKDGSPVLAFDGEDIAVVTYYHASDTLGWWEVIYDVEFDPTHWMPLPPAPVSALSVHET